MSLRLKALHLTFPVQSLLVRRPRAFPIASVQKAMPSQHGVVELYASVEDVGESGLARHSMLVVVSGRNQGHTVGLILGIGEKAGELLELVPFLLAPVVVGNGQEFIETQEPWIDLGRHDELSALLYHSHSFSRGVAP